MPADRCPLAARAVACPQGCARPGRLLCLRPGAGWAHDRRRPGWASHCPARRNPEWVPPLFLSKGGRHMPRFFFHLRCARKTLADCEGIMVANADAAHRQALATLRDFVQPSTGRVPPEWDGWLMQIAEAPELAAREQPPDERPSSRIVYLDIERARREFLSVENEVRRHIHRTTMLVDRTRSQTKALHAMLQAAAEVRQQSQELLTRSRSQSSIGDWCWAQAAATGGEPATVSQRGVI